VSCVAPTGIIDCDRREMNGEELAVSGGDRKGRDSWRQRLRQQATDAQTASDKDSNNRRRRLRQLATKTQTAADRQGDMTTEQVARLLTILKY
ncbi:MAG: hypothetical protein SPE85_03875, partial [Prevotella sp.]|nr:hypothetical protein [Prevotella sp.]